MAPLQGREARRCLRVPQLVHYGGLAGRLHRQQGLRRQYQLTREDGRCPNRNERALLLPARLKAATADITSPTEKTNTARDKTRRRLFLRRRFKHRAVLEHPHGRGRN